MDKKEFQINMTKDEMIRFYANKIVEDSIRDCSEFNTSCYLTEYGNGIDLSKYKNEILQQLYRDERIADVSIDSKLCIDMVFWTSYCPYYYDEVDNIDSKEEIKILSDFYYYCSNRVNQDGYKSVRTLILDFTDQNKYKNNQDNIYNMIKKNVIETGFIDKYIESNNETFVTLENRKEFENLLEIKINNLQKQYEKEKEEEFE